MKLTYNRFKQLVKERFVVNTLIEADEKSKKGKKSKSEKDEYEKSCKELGASFKCPRHGLSLETQMIRVPENTFKNPEARAAAFNRYGQMMPSTKQAQEDKTLDDLIRKSEKFKRILGYFYCPLMKQEANTASEERQFQKFTDDEGQDVTRELEYIANKLRAEVQRLGLKELDKNALSPEGKKLLVQYVKLKKLKSVSHARDVYEIHAAVRDADGNVVYEETPDRPGEKKDEERKKVKMTKKYVQCDYIVGGKWHKPGQISQTEWLNELALEPSTYRAFGQVAKEEETMGNIKRARPPRTEAFINKEIAKTKPETAPKALVAKINDMKEKGYHYAFVRQDQAAEKVYEFIKKNDITGVTGIGFSDDGRHIEVVLAVPFEKIDEKAKLEAQKDVDNQNKKLLSLHKKLTFLASLKPGNVPIKFSDEKNVGNKKILNIQQISGSDKDFGEKLQAMFKNIKHVRDVGKKGQLTKTELEFSPDGTPLFTGHDAWYLSYAFPKKIRELKDKAGENYHGPDPYSGMKSETIIQLFRNMGWELADSTVKAEQGAPEDDTSKWSSTGFRPSKKASGVSSAEKGVAWSDSSRDVVGDVADVLDDSLQARIDRATAELESAEAEEDEFVQGPKQFPDARGEESAVKKRVQIAREKLDSLLALQDEDSYTDLEYAQREFDDAKKMLQIARTSRDSARLQTALARFEKAEKDLEDYKELEQSKKLRTALQQGTDVDGGAGGEVESYSDDESDAGKGSNIDSFVDDLGDLDEPEDEDEEEEK